MSELLTLNGSYGEGGGQILRSALSLAAISGTPMRLIHIRAGRRRPGLRPQHLTAVQAAAALCDAHLEGNILGGQTLTFAPRSAPKAGEYTFDVTEASRSGSAGAVALILQTVLLPLALADGPSEVTLRGGTAVPMSPPIPYLEHVYLPMLAKMGVVARILRHNWGFYPKGGGEVVVRIEGGARLRPLCLTERGALERIEGIAFVAGLPSHIPQRMSDRARAVLRGLGVPVKVVPARVSARGVGAGIFLTAHYVRATAGFVALGRRGLPSERVAEMACEPLLAHLRSGAVADPWLGDQLVLPFALTEEPSYITLSCVTRHLLTNVWVARRFGFGAIRVIGKEGGVGVLTTMSISDQAGGLCSNCSS